MFAGVVAAKPGWVVAMIADDKQRTVFRHGLEDGWQGIVKFC